MGIDPEQLILISYTFLYGELLSDHGFVRENVETFKSLSIRCLFRAIVRYIFPGMSLRRELAAFKAGGYAFGKVCIKREKCAHFTGAGVNRGLPGVKMESDVPGAVFGIRSVCKKACFCRRDSCMVLPILFRDVYFGRVFPED